MNSRFKPIEIFDYETSERTSFKIIDPNGNEYLNLNHTEIKNISIDLKSGVVFLTGRILGAPKELELSKWHKNKKEIIKKIEFVIVRNGYARHYILNAGIQKVQENYDTMSYFVMFKHDNRQVSLYHTANFYSNDLKVDYKVHLPDVSIKNVTSDTLVNLGLSGIGVGLGIAGMATGAITIPVVISFSVGVSFLGSASFDLMVEVCGTPELKGQGDLIQQVIGELGYAIGKYKNTDAKKSEKRFELAYSQATLIYGLVSSAKSAKAILTLKNFREISNGINGQSYIKIKKIFFRSSKNATGFEGAERTFNKELFINDLTNTIGGGKAIYDNSPSK